MGVKGSSQDTDPTNDNEFDLADDDKHQNVADFAFQHQEEGKSLIWTKFRLNRTQPANGDLWQLA